MDYILEKLKKKSIYVPFFTVLILGLVTHMYMFVNKFPNSDALTSFYFDQNMVTSGRFFLGTVCSISSFYDLNWINGILSLLYISICAMMLIKLLDVKGTFNYILISALLVTFPALTATFAYLYTADGYMIGLLLSIICVYVSRKYKFGFIIGGILLSLSMGIYQAYLSFAVVLCIIIIINMLMLGEEIKKVFFMGLKFLGMGVIGGVLYKIILTICLKVQHKELDTYQGINTMGSLSLKTLPKTIVNMYVDFAAFTLKGNVLFREGFSASVWLLVLIAFIVLALIIIFNAKTYKKPLNILAIIVMLAIIPFGNNIIFLFSEHMEYHLLMRMQWVLYFIWAVVLADKVADKTDLKNIELKKERSSKNAIVFFFTVLTAVSLCFYIYGNIVVANICYYNMNESYEKTYGYLVRLIDRMEQTEGYYPGMKVAMVGVVSKESYPETNITLDITGNIRGTNQTIIPYKAEMYANFMSHYMNYELNFLEGEELEEVYYSDEYQELESFPSVNSMRVVNDTLYIKLE